MIAANYKQILTLKIGKRQRALQIASIALQVLSLGFIVIGIMINFYYYIGFLLMYGVGILVYQLYYMTAREYEYALTENQLIFVKKDIRLHAKTILTINFSEIQSMKTFSDIVKSGEIVVLDDVGRADAKEISYQNGREIGYVLFAPDEYMVALIEDRLIENKKK
ncbi:MAG: hypothetical protein PHE93_04960 [Clostridia bacterium]|nr:hypothetical protein [Clostridia bacterium]